jgi:CutC family
MLALHSNPAFVVEWNVELKPFGEHAASIQCKLFAEPNNFFPWEQLNFWKSCVLCICRIGEDGWSHYCLSEQNSALLGISLQAVYSVCNRQLFMLVIIDIMHSVQKNMLWVINSARKLHIYVCDVHFTHEHVFYIGMLRVVKQLVKIPVFVMIRPRGGDFHYSDQEMDVMRTDIKILKENGADGIVLGLLHR